MTVSITTTLQVPAGTSVYALSQEFATYMKETYLDTGRVIVESTVNDTDNSVVTTLNFTTDADKTAYFADARVIASMNERRVHNANNNIVLVSTTLTS
jgi:hypothetical protein